MSQFANPEMIHNLSFGDKMAGTGITAVMGMGITFVILFLLWFLVAMMDKIVVAAESSAASKKAAKAEQAAKAAAAAETAPAENAMAATAVGTEAATDDAELMAVISAAIAAYEATSARPVDTGGLVVKRIQRISGKAPTWAAAGVRKTIENRKM